MIYRKQNWEQILEAFLYSRINTKFERGFSDCVPFCADGILQYTGVDLAQNFRQRYSSDKEALRLTMGHPKGFKGLVLDEMATFKLPIKPWTYAKRGDLVFLEYSGEEGLGLCNGRLAATPGKTQINWVDMKHSTIVWEISFP